MLLEERGDAIKILGSTDLKISQKTSFFGVRLLDIEQFWAYNKNPWLYTYTSSYDKN